ncbi:hypothetical protein SERLA73DRAFT_182348 [Serpula lacrymans var. lacrymans S7.3]|uniref:Uncharacterized protein n=1 Tax=Serpula lacrymans var. lacrymans (strain S7.3) TaxID=936435 RepID=F8PXB2_SERL3|nr:hypothetical protein SERLA73DRAFT_182348 [Serpula lacrymans var. lacrymans S7.3]
MGGTKRRVSVRRKTKERSHAAVATYLQTTDVYAPACATAAATADGETPDESVCKKVRGSTSERCIPRTRCTHGYGPTESVQIMLRMWPAGSYCKELPSEESCS